VWVPASAIRVPRLPSRMGPHDGRGVSRRAQAGVAQGGGDRLLAGETGHVGGGDGAGEMVPLGEVAAELGEGGGLAV
jgi:hypothetical protein